MLSIGLDIIQELYPDNTAVYLVKFIIQLCSILKLCIIILTVYIQKQMHNTEGK